MHWRLPGNLRMAFIPTLCILETQSRIVTHVAVAANPFDPFFIVYDKYSPPPALDTFLSRHPTKRLKQPCSFLSLSRLTITIQPRTWFNPSPTPKAV